MVASSSIARVRSYIILLGLERSLADNIGRNFDLSNRTFLNEDEQSRALQRLREDQGDSNIELDDLDVEDLLPYLDLGDLLSLLNRHARDARNALPEHIAAATNLISRLETLTIRKRVMHPIRPLEVDDLPKLSKMASDVQKVAPSLTWDLLAINLRRLSKESSIVDVAIPSFWAEESPVIHNLPSAEFDDTGFIGRAKERKELRRLLESDHRVITVVGGAGIGKTALALRVCNDLLEDPKPIFERIVWVTLKTRHLTAEGIKQINEAIDSLGALIDNILRSLKITAQANWDAVLKQLEASKTLLVIDNLETLGEEVRELVLNIPAKSKVLFTSRVGLGEIEIRYELSGFAPKDAMALFRSLVAVYNCSPFKSLSQEMVNRYTGKLGYNPLLIKWFVLAVGKGVDPEVLLSKGGLNEPLSFFYGKIYEKLNTLAKHILSILLASRRELTRAQLQDLTGAEFIPFLEAIQDLIRTSMVERVSTTDGSMVFHIGSLVYEYLSENYPPNDTVVKTVREHIKAWQVEQDKSTLQTARYRYGPFLLHVDKADERIAAQHLLRALRAIESRDLETATVALTTAEQLTPTWWEVYRVKARLLEAENKPIYEVEEAFEQSIRVNDNDVIRYHYTVYLLEQNEYERALEQIEKAATHEAALPMTFKSLKGLILMRIGKIPEAILELQEVWANRSKDLPVKVGLTQGTQLADAYRRQAEQMRSLGKYSEAIDSCVKAAEVINEAAKDYGYDGALVEAAVNVIACGATHVDQSSIGQEALVEVARKWDASAQFRRRVLGFHKTLAHFQRVPELENLFPNISSELRTMGYVRRYVGKICSIIHTKFFRFIDCTDLGRVHFGGFSLIDNKIWPELKVGDAVIFGIVLPQDKDKLPHAVNLELDITTN